MARGSVTFETESTDAVTTGTLVDRLAEAWARARRDAPLGSGALGRLEVIAAHFLLPVKSRIPPLAPIAVPLYVRVGGQRRTFWVADRSELLTLGDVVLNSEYAAAGDVRPEVILDLGANAGAATLYFASRFPGARIYALEPDPSTFRRLQRNVGNLPGIEVLDAAVAGTSGRARFEQADRSWSSGLAVDQDDGAGVEVEVVSFDDLLARLALPQVDLVKIDIEGAEYAVFDAATRLDDVGEVVGELHHDHPDTPADIQTWLEHTAHRAHLTVVESRRDGGLFLLRRPRRGTASRGGGAAGPDRRPGPGL